jgi:RNA polymerase sigma-70 factor (ECF subfamily)
MARSWTMEDQLFETIYEHTARPLWSYVARICGDASAADDILQETYLRYLRTARRPTDVVDAKRFIYKIATNLVYDRFRKLKRRVEIDIDETEIASRGDDPASEIEMTQLFSRLRQQERMLLWLAYVEGYDHRQIARIANVSKFSVKVLLFRARKRLAALMESEKE